MILGNRPSETKTVEITKTSFTGGTVAVSGLSKILAVFACLNQNTNYVYGGGLDVNGTWQRIGYNTGSNGVSSVAADGSSFTWTDGTARTIKFFVLGEE